MATNCLLLRTGSPPRHKGAFTAGLTSPALDRPHEALRYSKRRLPGPPSSRAHQRGMIADLIPALAHLVALVEQLELLHLLECFRKGRFGLFELELKLGG